MINVTCQLVQCTLITDLLSNLKGLLASMIIEVLIVIQNVLCQLMYQNHKKINQLLLGTQLPMCNNNYIVIFAWRTLFDMNISYFPNLQYWLPLLENLGTVKLSCLKHCQRLFVQIIFSRNFMPKTNKFNS